MKSMNLEKISTLMDKFEKVRGPRCSDDVMEGAMSQTTANIPQGSVDDSSQAADEAWLELNMELPGAAEATIGQSFAASTEQDELSQRLARLRQV